MLLNELASIYGYDFTNYARTSLKRRVNRLLLLDRFPSFAELLFRVKSDEAYLNHFIEEITVNVTEMFRDPSVFKTIREKILPVLGTHPLIRIWHAGCATGEEVYSMAKMILATHNLVSDRSFNEFQLIFCRNVLIYFDKTLQDKVLTLFDDSLEKLGFLVLGSKENIRFSNIDKKYLQMEPNEKIWRKVN